MIKSVLTESGSGRQYHTSPELSLDPTLLTTNYGRVHGTFASVTLATAGTQTIVEANENEGIVITDLLISGEKVNGGTIAIQFTDAVNIVQIFLATVTDGPVNFAVPFQGRWAGWQACDIKVVTVGNIDGSVAVGYYRTPEEFTLPFAEWDAAR